MVDNLPISKGRPQRYLVRFDHDLHAVVVDLCGSTPALNPDDTVCKRVKRMAGTYQFFVWESFRGDLVGAHFALSAEFFLLQEAPSSLLADVRWLALEFGCPDLATIDFWWVALTGMALTGQEERGDG